MMSGLILWLTSSAGKWLAAGLGSALVCGATFFFGRRGGEAEADLASAEGQTAAEAKVVEAQAQAWKAQQAVPEDPDVVLKDHRL